MSRLIEPQELASLLASALLGLRIQVDRADEPPESTTTGELADVHLVLIEGHGAYPTGIDVFTFRQHDGPRVHVALARLLSTLLTCDAVCAGTPYAPKDPVTGEVGPYWSLLWRRGQAWLANDSATDPYDGEGGPVRPVRVFDSPLPALNANGSLDER